MILTTAHPSVEVIRFPDGQPHIRADGVAYDLESIRDIRARLREARP